MTPSSRSILSDRVYLHLFLAQVVALLGTGLATVALGLLAFELAGGQAGVVLGTALAIKMVAYVVVAPVAVAFAERLPRRALLVSLDLVRACVVLVLPFVTEIWQVYLLVFLLQAASAAFTPVFQALIPEVLPDEVQYTRALSLSRLAYDLESVASPLAAAALLSMMTFSGLFVGTTVGFLLSAALVLSVHLPSVKSSERRSIYDATTRGIRIYLATPRLRGLLALHLAAAAAGAMVIVNTVVLVQAHMALTQHATAIALAAFGSGSIVAALLLPRLLERMTDRTLMVRGAVLMVLALVAGSAALRYGYLLAIWFFIGFGYSLVQTPSGRLLRRSSDAEARPALFAAEFALSHACWLVTYPAAGWLGTKMGMSPTFVLMAAISAAATVAAWRFWPHRDPEEVEHEHANLSDDHPHISDAVRVGASFRHRHLYGIDSHHPEWPQPDRASRQDVDP